MIIKHRTATLFQKNITFRQRRQLPPRANGSVVVGPGQELSMVQVIARIEQPGHLSIVPAASLLGIGPGELPQYVTVQKGMEVRPGQLMGEKKGRFGRTKTVEAAVDGEIYAIEDGSIFIQRKSKTAPIRSLLKGWVAYSIPDRGVAVETKGTRLEAACGSTHEGFGELKVLTNDPAATVNPDHLSNQVQGKILVVGHLDQEKWIASAADRGAHGVITGTISGELFLRLNQLELPIFATDGVGVHGMSSLFYDCFGRYDGREGGLLAAETSHANRPLIVLADHAPDSTIFETERPQLSTGSRVRVLQTDAAGMLGEVQRIYPGHRVEVGQRSVGQADVLLANGDVITVLCRNLDIIM